MAALGNLIGKVTASAAPKSVHKTAQYEKLNQDPSDNEEEDDVLFQRKHDNGITQNGHAKETETIELDNAQSSAGKPLFNDVKVRLSRPSMLARFRRISFILSIVFVIGLVLLLSLVLPYHSWSQSQKVPVVSTNSSTNKQTSNWTVLVNDYGIESVMRALDIDGDGLEDIILGMGSPLGKAVVETRQTMHDLCKQINKPYPCGGILLAMRGYDGKELWRIPTFAEIFALNCGHLDINKDGFPDCIAAGRMGTLFAFEPRNGTILWEGDEDVLIVSWNIYTPQVLGDLDGDGVAEVLVPHGGQVVTNSDTAFYLPKKDQDLIERLPGRLLLVSGATGKSLGQYLEMPHSKETYMAPVLHTRKDGSQYILMGSGGESVSVGKICVAGSLFIISVADFYRYVKQLDPREAIPGYKDPTEPLDKLLACNRLGICEIYRGDHNGVVVPPVEADITGDGVNDIILISQEGTIAAFDGDTFKSLWKNDSVAWESSSVPAPGYFNNDDVLDFMIHQNHGQYPTYDKFKVCIIDGRTGKSLWQLETLSEEFSSDLVLRTNQDYRDVFIFRVQGPASPENQAAPPYAGKARKRRRSTERDRRQYDQNKIPYHYGYHPNGRTYRPAGQGRFPGAQYTAKSYGQAPYNPAYQGSLYGNSLGRQRPSYDLSDYQPQESFYNYYHPEEYEEALQDSGVPGVEATDECEKDLSHFSSEIFMMDRTNKFTPLHVYSVMPAKHYYNMTDELLQILEQNLNLESLEQSLNLNPEKFKEYIDSMPKELSCALWRPKETSTGVLSDVDGDGTIDLVTTVHMEVKLHYGSYPLSKVKTSVIKINLSESLHKRKMVPLGPTVPPSNDLGHQVQGHKDITQVQFLSLNKQPWRQYMGSQGDNIYRKSVQKSV